MLIESMKKEKQLDMDLSSPVAEGGGSAEISHDWEDDDESITVGSVEDHWCIVSDDDLQTNKDDLPKGNTWDEQATAEESSWPTNAVDKIKQLDLHNMLPPSVKNPRNMLLLLHLLVGMIVVIHLAWDRYSWRNSAMHLEQELRSISEQKVVPPVMEPLAFAHVPENDIDPPGFSDWHEEKPDNVIMDNCWVHARASVSFRECAEDAKDTVKEVTTEVVETAKTFAKHTWKAAKKFKKHATAAAAAAAARRRNRPY